ncbi:chlorite dismutase family protein [Poriferisphaera sp. WC338]|uniref:chlorite dismutase family protein n=1 Tax=Poriferisphaera sp. WC338 TaxID=3425129 RepID=UPI003D817887
MSENHEKPHGQEKKHGSGGHPGGYPGGRPVGGDGKRGGPPAGMQLEEVDLNEKGAQGAKSDRRMYMQLLVFTGTVDEGALIEGLKKNRIEGALYADVNDPYGYGLLTMSEKPGFFAGKLRDFLRGELFDQLMLRDEYVMFGRTYSLGYEPDLNEVLLDRPRRYVRDKDWPWAVWYPLRRAGSFEQLSGEEQMAILREHGGIGFSYGRAGVARDVRLACHGMGGEDNDFVIGLIGQELHPLSALVQRMRKTKQTSQYLEELGPFFVGKVLWQSK